MIVHHNLIFLHFNLQVILGCISGKIANNDTKPNIRTTLKEDNIWSRILQLRLLLQMMIMPLFGFDRCGITDNNFVV